jgi:trigger factor
MKKENKKLAQEKRAKEKKMKKVKAILGNVCKIGIPAVLLLAVIIVAIVNPFAKAETDSSSSNTSNEGSASTVLSKDKSLTVKDGDTVNIDYVGSIDGVEFAGGNTQGAGADLTIGSGMFIDNFEEQLIGAHPGDEVEVIVTFPENYGNEELNGKEALFKVVVNGIYE